MTNVVRCASKGRNLTEAAAAPFSPSRVPPRAAFEGKEEEEDGKRSSRGEKRWKKRPQILRLVSSVQIRNSFRMRPRTYTSGVREARRRILSQSPVGTRTALIARENGRRVPKQGAPRRRGISFPNNLTRVCKVMVRAVEATKKACIA